MKISMVAAIGKNRELGKGNKLIWHIPSDLKRFRDLTSGHPIIMGRKTYQSINRLLPDRTNIIITRDQNYKVDGAVIVNSIEDAIEKAKGKPGSEEVFIIGGAQVYALGMPFADKLYLTKIDAEEPTADAFFPDYSKFRKVITKVQGYSRSQGHKYTFLDLGR